MASELLEDYVSRSFRVRSVRVTEENIQEVAEMVGSEVSSKAFLNVNRTLTDRKYFEIIVGPNEQKARVYIGQWLTWMNGTYRIFTNSAFKYKFQKPKPVDDDKRLSVIELVEKAMGGYWATASDLDVMFRNDLAEEFIELFK